MIFFDADELKELYWFLRKQHDEGGITGYIAEKEMDWSEAKTLFSALDRIDKEFHHELEMETKKDGEKNDI